MSNAMSMTITPDLQSREAVMAAAGRAQFSVTQGGGATAAGITMYVRLDCKRKLPESSVKKYEACSLSEATHVSTSEKGYGTTSLGTYYPPKGQFTEGRLYPKVAPDHPHMTALEVVVAVINGEDAPVSGDYTVEVESRCGMCGRKLEDPVSVQRGIGPECAQKPTGTKILHASVFGQQEMDYSNVTPGSPVSAVQEADEPKLDGMRVMQAHADVVSDAINKAEFSSIEKVQEEIAVLQGELVEQNGIREHAAKRMGEIQDDISIRQGHLAELKEAAQT